MDAGDLAREIRCRMTSARVGTAALGCPVERSSTAVCKTSQSADAWAPAQPLLGNLEKPGGSLLRWTDEDICPYAVRGLTAGAAVPKHFRFMPGLS